MAKGLRHPPRPPGLVLGYHGCNRDLGEQVLAGKTDLQAQPKESDWLGDGVYFWQDDPQRAFEWARDRKQHPAPFVIGAVLVLGHCLDLTNRACLDLVFDAHEELCSELQAQGQQVLPNVGSNRKRDCQAINYAIRIQKESASPERAYPEFDAVRGAFLEGRQLGDDEDSGIWSQNHIQISIINPNCIKGLFRVGLDRPIDLRYPPV